MATHQMPSEASKKAKGYRIQADLVTNMDWGTSHEEVDTVQFHAHDKNGIAVGNTLTVTFPVVAGGLGSQTSVIKFNPPYSRYSYSDGGTTVWSVDDALINAELCEVAAGFAKVLNDIAGPEIKKAREEAERRREEAEREWAERRERQRIAEEKHREARKEYTEKLHVWEAEIEEHLKWYVGPVEMRMKRHGKSGGISIREIHSVSGGQISLTTIKGRRKRFSFTEIEELALREGERRYTKMDIPFNEAPEWKDPRLEEATTS